MRTSRMVVVLVACTLCCALVALMLLWSSTPPLDARIDCGCHETATLASALPPRDNPWEDWPAPLDHAPCRPRLYIYDDLPSALQPMALSDCARTVPMAYRAEVVLLAKLRSPPFADLYTTHDPTTATHFMVPFLGSCWLFSHCFDRGGRTDSHDNCAVDAKYVTPLLDYIAQHHPWWNRSNGADHVLVHPMDRRSAYYTDLRLRNTIALVTNGDRRSASGFRPLREIVIPSVTAPLVRNGQSNIQDIVGVDGNPYDRPITALFRGHFTAGAASSPNERYGHGIRWLLSRTKVPGWVIGGKQHIVGWYTHELAHARFGISPEGWTLDNTRLWDYLAFGVVPVIIADGIVLPFEDDFDWDAIALRVRREDAHRLPQIIESVPPERALRMHRRGWTQGRFVLCEYDAWHYIARALCRLSGINDPQLLPFNVSTHSEFFWSNPHMASLLT